MALLLIFVFLAVTVTLFLVPGAALLGLVPLLAALAVVGWTALALLAGDAPSNVVRHTRRPELLGPGGPDDPGATRS
jgi:hypothetical protein